jgi:hypothetical protein
MEGAMDYQIYQEMSLVSESYHLSLSKQMTARGISIAALLDEGANIGTTHKATQPGIYFHFSTNKQMLLSTTQNANKTKEKFPFRISINGRKRMQI